MINANKPHREREVLGTWKWGSQRVQFEDSASFTVNSTVPTTTLYGSWEISGSHVHVTTYGSGPAPTPDWDLELSPDGKTMKHLRGGGGDLTKISIYTK